MRWWDVCVYLVDHVCDDFVVIDLVQYFVLVFGVELIFDVCEVCCAHRRDEFAHFLVLFFDRIAFVGEDEDRELARQARLFGLIEIFECVE